MRQGQQHRRGRGRNNNNNNNNANSHAGNRKGQNPLTRSFESNGPDVKVRGTPAHIAEKYLQLARDAQSSGDHVLAENYLQHAEHYNRIILAYREQQIQQSGEQMNGNGRHHSQGSRHDMGDGDDVSGDDQMGDDPGGSDQPMFVRQPAADQPSGDMQPSFGEQRGPPQHQQRHDQQSRFRDRPMRHERNDRQDGGYDRSGERQDRPERHERQGERGFDRNRERPYRQPEQGGEHREMRAPREPREYREPRDSRDYREPREPREPREHREPRPQPPEAGRDMPREATHMPREVPPAGPVAEPPIMPMPPVADDTAAAPLARPEGGPRRRERFGLGADQPEFLRRPVRRPRREVEQELAPDAPPAPILPPADEPPRE